MNKKQKVKKADERRLKYIKSIEDGLANFDNEIKRLQQIKEDNQKLIQMRMTIKSLEIRLARLRI